MDVHGVSWMFIRAVPGDPRACEWQLGGMHISAVGGKSKNWIAMSFLRVSEAEQWSWTQMKMACCVKVGYDGKDASILEQQNMLV